jgi:hypothetical protein
MQVGREVRRVCAGGGADGLGGEAAGRRGMTRAEHRQAMRAALSWFPWWSRPFVWLTITAIRWEPRRKP